MTTKTSTMASPWDMPHPVKKVAILFAGGPAPGANAVISTAATAFLRHGIEVVGIKHGYSNLVEYSPERPLVEGRDYVTITQKMLGRTRNSQGIIIGTARANPGKNVSQPRASRRCRARQAAQDGLRSAAVDRRRRPDLDRRRRHAQDGQQVQALPGEAAARTRCGFPVVHLPKTIDNDYRGIDFTFGYFTAVDFLGREVRNLIADARPIEPTSSSSRWAAARAGWPTAWRSPARRAS